MGNKIGRVTPAGTISEFSVPSAESAPTSITAGPDGNLWFTENGSNKIGRITPTGVITEFLIPRERPPATDGAGARSLRARR